MLKPKSLQQEQGFALVEVLVAILITTLFVAVSMQAMLVAAVLKARAQEFTEATTWIQEDLENVKYSAASLQYTSLVDETEIYPTGVETAPLLHETTDRKLYVASVDGFEVNDALKVGTDSSSNTISSIDTANKTITLSAELGTTQPKGALVTATTRCNLARTTGFADRLRDQVTGSNKNTVSNDFENPPSTGNNLTSGDPLKSKLTSKKFSLTRTIIIPDSAPYNVLEVSYSVAPPNAHTTLTAAAASNTSSLSVTSATGFKAGDKLTVGTDTDNKIASISGTTITLTSELGSVQSSGSIVDASVANFYTKIIPNAAFQCP